MAFLTPNPFIAGLFDAYTQASGTNIIPGLFDAYSVPKIGTYIPSSVDAIMFLL